MATLFEVRIQLKDVFKKVNLNDSGGVVFVAKAGTSEKAALQDQYGSVLTNPIQLTSGLINFFFDTAITANVDLYGMTGKGHWFEYINGGGVAGTTTGGVSPSGPNEINVDTSDKRHRMKIPFSYVDCTPGTEYETGFKLPVPAKVLDRLHGGGILVTTASAAGTATLSVGILSSETGGAATGFINGSSTAALGQVTPTNGSLFSSNAPYNTDTLSGSTPYGTDISYTLGSGNGGEGFIILPYQLS